MLLVLSGEYEPDLSRYVHRKAWAGIQLRMPRYADQICSPAATPRKAPANIHGPKGTFDLRPPRPATTIPTAKSPPRRNAPNPPTTRAPHPSQPRKIPRSPASLTSPQPIPAG